MSAAEVDLVDDCEARRVPLQRPRLRLMPSLADALARDVAAFDALCSNRPLMPPVLPAIAGLPRSAGSLVLQKEKRGSL